MSENPIILGVRIGIRPFALDDLDAFSHWQEPHHRWHQFDGPYYPKANRTQIGERVAKIKKKLEAGKNNPQMFAIADAQSDALLGTVTWYWQSEETNWLSVGIAIFDDTYWSRGIGFEALGLWSQLLFDTKSELVRLDLRTWSGNIGMIKLAEKLGYQEEARFRMARIVNGEYYDGMGYGILRSEWESQYPEGFANHIKANPKRQNL